MALSPDFLRHKAIRNRRRRRAMPRSEAATQRADKALAANTAALSAMPLTL
jgi:hypothetical protein